MSETGISQVEDSGEEAPTDVYVLRHPVRFGRNQDPIETLKLKPSGAAMRGVKIVTTGDGGVEYEPYKFAELGLRLAGVERAVVDKMHLEDVNGLAKVAMGFTFGGPETGKTPSR